MVLSVSCKVGLAVKFVQMLKVRDEDPDLRPDLFFIFFIGFFSGNASQQHPAPHRTAHTTPRVFLESHPKGTLLGALLKRSRPLVPCFRN